MSRASAAKNPDSNSLHSQHPRDPRDPRDRPSRRAGSRRADSSVTSYPPSPALTAPARSATATPGHHSYTPSPDDHERRAGGLLNVAAADCSSADIPSTMSNLGPAASLHALTPLTSTDSSPPGKLASPRSTKPAHDTMHANTVSHTAPGSAPSSNAAAATITPVHTPPETRTSVFPTEGEFGKRLSYDPLLDAKLDKRSKSKVPAVYKPILVQVRDGYNCSYKNPPVGSSCDAKANLTCVAGRPTTRPPPGYCWLYHRRSY